MTLTAVDSKFTNAVADGVAIMLLYDLVGRAKDKQGNSIGISGTRFAEEIYWHKDMGRKVKVYLNGPGGQIFDGMNIIQAILDAQADTHYVGLAASMHGVIGQFGAKRTCNNFAIAMIHPPQGASGPLNDHLKGSLTQMLTQRSKLSAKQIADLMEDKGAEMWFNAKDLEKYGLVEKGGIIDTAVVIPEAINKLKVDEEFVLTDEITNIYTTFVNTLHKPQPKTMDKIALAALGLPENASQEDILKAINAMKAAAEAAKNATDAAAAAAAATAAKTETTPPTNAAEGETMKQLKAVQKVMATDLVENAVKEGRIKADAKDSFVELAVNNYDLAKKTLAGITPATENHTSVMTVVNGNSAQNVAGDVKNTYEWLAENDPTKLRNILETDPKKYDQLVAEHTKKHQV